MLPEPVEMRPHATAALMPAPDPEEEAAMPPGPVPDEAGPAWGSRGWLPLGLMVGSDPVLLFRTRQLCTIICAPEETRCWLGGRVLKPDRREDSC